MLNKIRSKVFFFLLKSSSLHLFTNDFGQSSICFWQTEVMGTNCTSMKQFRFYCDKLHCIRSDSVQTVVNFVSVKYSLFQMQHESIKQMEDCSKPFVKRCIKVSITDTMKSWLENEFMVSSIFMAFQCLRPSDVQC